MDVLIVFVCLFVSDPHILRTAQPACGVQVRDEIEHLLDDNEDMAQLYLTRKWIQNQQGETSSPELAADGVTSTGPDLHRLGSTRSGSFLSSHSHDDDVEDLEMLLESYFMQLDGTRNKILSVSPFLFSFQ